MTSTSTPASTDPQTQARFKKDGYIAPIPVLSPQEVAHYLALYQDFHAKHKSRIDALPPNRKSQITSETHFVYKWVHDLVTHPRILAEVEKILGPNLLAWNTTWFTKMPGDKTYVSWHQDGSYWQLSPVEVATAWVALTPAMSENGCLRVVPGSHTQPNMPQRETYAADNALSRGQEIAVKVDENNAVDIHLQPGQMSLHHIWIVHGSNANTSQIPRIGLAIRYLSTRVKQDSPGKPIAMLVKGKDEHHNFEIAPPPTTNEGYAGEGKHAQIMQQIRESIMQKK